MNHPCARCKKLVYPMEKLNCLDKVWHKGCFTCETCNLKLTMKNYKGYNKLPYCNTHYPTTKFTQVADTPEALRLAKQQKNQSELEYRKDKMEAFKSFTAVADTVSNRQASQAGKLASNLGYQTAPHRVGHENDGRPDPSSIVNARHTAGGAAQPSAQPPAQPAQPPAQSAQPPPPSSPTKATPAKNVYVALYDYTAADDDEVSIKEGDRLTEVNVIDEGWMEGRNSSSGQFGMFPSNYVQQV
ncbi:LIM and SH3 domain protein 1-like [Clavelina lepadiformis]|uniref:LIM and SH3 domain protein 1 n=1 Tax=Clavelina lepadiformis TaxID=159417 RepID=A0ABP0F0A0_CLALP